VTESSAELQESSAELQELLGKLGKLEVFAVFMTPTEKFQSPYTPEGDKLLVEHLRFLFALQNENRLLASGPLDLDRERIEGMCVLRAESREDAEAIAEREPYAAAGWRTNTVRAWQLNEGTLVEPAKLLLGS
jgi:uncharacterized protein YciI